MSITKIIIKTGKIAAHLNKKSAFIVFCVRSKKGDQPKPVTYVQDWCFWDEYWNIFKTAHEVQLHLILLH